MCPRRRRFQCFGPCTADSPWRAGVLWLKMPETIRCMGDVDELAAAAVSARWVDLAPGDRTPGLRSDRSEAEPRAGTACDRRRPGAGPGARSTAHRRRWAQCALRPGPDAGNPKR